MINDSNHETNFSHKVLLTDTQVLRLRKAFENGSSIKMKFSKTQLSKMVQLGGFLPLFGPVLCPLSYLTNPEKSLIIDGIEKVHSLS